MMAEQETHHAETAQIERLKALAASALFWVSRALTDGAIKTEYSEELISAVRDLSNLLGDADGLWGGEE